jgi:hypothetical protein
MPAMARCESETFDYKFINGTTITLPCSTICTPDKSSSLQKKYCSDNCPEYSENCLVRSPELPSAGTYTVTTETTANAGQSSDDITTAIAGQSSDDSTVSNALIIGLSIGATAIFAAVVIAFLICYIRRRGEKPPIQESCQNQLNQPDEIEMPDQNQLDQQEEIGQQEPLMQRNVGAANLQRASQIPAADGQQTQHHAVENGQNNQGPSTREERTDATTGPENVTVPKQPLDNG